MYALAGGWWGGVGSPGGAAMALTRRATTKKKKTARSRAKADTPTHAKAALAHPVSLHHTPAASGTRLFTLAMRRSGAGVECAIALPDGRVAAAGRVADPLGALPPSALALTGGGPGSAPDAAGPAAAALALAGDGAGEAPSSLLTALTGVGALGPPPTRARRGGGGGSGLPGAPPPPVGSTAALVAAALGGRGPPPAAAAAALAAPAPPAAAAPAAAAAAAAARPAWLTSFDMHLAQYVRARDVRHLSSVLELPWPPALRGCEITHLRTHPAFVVVGDWVALAGTPAAMSLTVAAGPGGVPPGVGGGPPSGVDRSDRGGSDRGGDRDGGGYGGGGAPAPYAGAYLGSGYNGSY